MMADKNQQSVPNGMPPFPGANLISPNSQVETMQSSVNNSPISTLQQKSVTSIANGQIFQNVKRSNTITSSASNYPFHQSPSIFPTTRQQTPLLSSKPSLPGNPLVEPNQNISSNPNQINSSNVSGTQWKNIPHSAGASMPSNLQSNRQNIIKPTPIIPNKLNNSNSNINNLSMQPPSSNDAVSQNEQMAKVNSTGFQYSNKSVPGPGGPGPNPIPRLLSQPQTINKPLGGPPITTTPHSGFVSKPSPYDKPNIPNMNSSLYGTPTSQKVNLLQQPPHQNLSSSEPNIPQQFPPPVSESSSSSSSQPMSLTGPPLGYLPQQTVGSQQYPLKTTAPNTLNSGDRHSLHGYPKPDQGPRMYQNQFSGQMGPLPPPPLPGEIPPFKNAHNMQNSYNRMPSNAVANNMKHLGMHALGQGMERMSVTQHGYNKLWVNDLKFKL